MAQPPKILNQAAIDAAIQAERVRQQQLAAAQAQVARLQPEVQSAEAIQRIAKSTSKISKKTGKPKDITKAEEALGVSTRVGEQILAPYQTAMGQVSALGTPIQVPVAIYERTTGTSDTQSAYDLLFEQFSQYGLGGLIEPLKGFIEEGISPAELTLRLRNTDAYKKRFAANQQRINRGLRALSEAEYIGLEDQYQNVMRQYGLPASYYTRGDMGRQEGFEKFISGDVSAAELEDRIQTAQNRVINAAPEIATTLKSFYPDITNGDILAYALDPDKAITEIRRKVTAAEIGGAATMAGLNRITPDMTPEQIAAIRGRAEELGRYGVTAQAARQGFQTVAEVAPRGGQLASFYKETPYTQTTAEQEVFGLTGAVEAGRQRRKLTELETAAFSGQAGAAGGAFARDRAGAF